MDFKQMYEEQLAKSGAGYDEQIAGYRQAQADEQASLEAQRAASQKELEDNRFTALQNAYGTRRMAEKNLPQFLASQGITGGLTETTASGLYSDWQNAQNAANTSHNKAITELKNSHMGTLASLKTKWAQTIGEAEQNKRNDAFARAQFAYQAYLAEEEKKKQEAAAAASRSSSSGGGSSSGGSSNAGKYYLNATGKYYNTQAEAAAALKAHTALQNGINAVQSVVNTVAGNKNPTRSPNRNF